MRTATIVASGVVLGVVAMLATSVRAGTATPRAPLSAGAGAEALAPLGPGRPLARCLRESLFKLRALRDELNLSPDQRQAIANVLQGHKAEIIAAIRSVHEKRKALLQAVRAENVDEQAIRQAAQGMATTIGDAAVVWARARREVLAVLTPEQRQKVERALAEIQNSVEGAMAELGAQ